MVLRRGVPAGQPALDAVRRCGCCFATGARPRGPRRFRCRACSSIWVLFVCVFFSLSDSKLIPYILPAMPALALLIAALPEGLLRRDLPRTALVTLALAIGARAACACSRRRTSPRRSAAATFCRCGSRWREIAALLAVSGLYVLSRRRREATRASAVPGGRLVPGRACSRCAPPRRSRPSIRASTLGARIARDAARGSPLQRGDV